MLPISTKELVPFAPLGADGAEFRLEVPTIRTRAKFHADLARNGLRNPSPAEVREAVRDGIHAVVEESQRAELLELLDQVAGIAHDMPPELIRRYGELERQMAPAWPPLGDLLAAKAEFNELAPMVAARRFLKEADGHALAFDRDGCLTEESLESLGHRLAAEVGFFALSLLYLPKAAEKNSGSPSQSHDAPANTTADGGHPKGSTDGTSSGTSTTPTPVTG